MTKIDLTKSTEFGKWPKINYDDINSEVILAWAKTKDLIVVLGDERLLLVDLDSQEQYEIFQNRTREFIEADMAPIGDMEIFKSMSGNLHVQLTLLRAIPSVPERLLLQTFLGSDQLKERLSYERYIHKDPHPTLLVRPKGFPLVNDFEEFWHFKPEFPSKG